MSLPTQQQAAVKQGDGPKVEVSTIDVPQLGPGQILCKVNYSGLCGTDKSFVYNEYATMGIQIQKAAKGIAGHEGAGTVVAVADDVKSLWKEGDRVGVKWVAGICGKCEFCTNGHDEMHCPEQINSGYKVPGKAKLLAISLKLLADRRIGTFQEYLVTDARYATRIPEGVKDEEAGPIMCGGVTAYVACKQSQVKPGQWIVLPGAGGGVGHLAIQYAKAMGMRVIAIDGGDEKKNLCLKLGAEHFIDYKTNENVPAEVLKITIYGAHGVIVTAASREGYATAPMLLRPRGTLVAVGIAKDPTVMAGAPLGLLTSRRLNIVGSFVGTLKDVEEALEFTARGLVRPVLTHGTLNDINELFAKMHAGELAGRAVIKVSV